MSRQDIVHRTRALAIRFRGCRLHEVIEGRLICVRVRVLLTALSTYTKIQIVSSEYRSPSNNITCNHVLALVWDTTYP